MLSYGELRDRAEAYARSLHKRATQACKEAGIGGVDMCVIHNAMLDYQDGKPWAEINYSKLRLARHLLDRQFEASRIVHAALIRVDWMEIARHMRGD